ncbi:MAG: BatD family protein [Bacteriovoracaceae bacterium]|nr:BatD family protein [Bacteriovoracaceae bacterium]
MKKIGNFVAISIFFLFFSSQVFAQVALEFSTERPVAGEGFSVSFKIQTDGSEEPQIEFTPEGIEVQDKSFDGVSTQTTYINGKLSTTRELIITYNMVAQKAGRIALKNIKVKVGEKSYEHPDKSFQSLSTPQQLPDVLLLAVPSKKSAYRGEGIYVRYFIYHKIGLSNFNILQYPKLDYFTKRYLQDNKQFTETASYEGEMYYRTLIYAAYVFPDKEGKLQLDPMKASINYPSGRGSGDPFDLLGFQRGRMVSKTMSSAAVAIEVKSLPTSNVPKNFTGLVGVHTFELDAPRTKLLVNDPLEIRLKIQGPGNLESMDPPQLLSHPQLEQFDVTSNFEIQNTNSASKSFNYVFLPRSNLKLPESQFSLSYFDPEKQIYVEVPLKMAALEASGGNLAGAQNLPAKSSGAVDLNQSATENLPQGTIAQLAMPAKSFVGPLWVVESPKNYYKLATVVILGLFFLLAIYFFVRDFLAYRKWKGVEAVWGSIFSGSITLVQFMAILDQISKSNKDATLFERVHSLKIDDENKKVLLKILENLQSPYFQAKSDQDLRLDKEQILGLRQLRDYATNHHSSPEFT